MPVPVGWPAASRSSGVEYDSTMTVPATELAVSALCCCCLADVAGDRRRWSCLLSWAATMVANGRKRPAATTDAAAVLVTCDAGVGDADADCADAGDGAGDWWENGRHVDAARRTHGTAAVMAAGAAMGTG